ncbi:MAG TPA: hypothetical protein VMR62_37515 [Bryobacteraceae bacterium]|nr:hypothetical protein [Bryobacteraceae bacterium]
MSWWDRGLALAAGLLLLVSLALWWQSRRELDSVRRELRAVSAANEFLKRTLGDMTIALTAKDKEMDRLGRVPCEGQEKARPGSGARTDRRKVSASPAGRRGNRGSFDSLPDSFPRLLQPHPVPAALRRLQLVYGSRLAAWM